MDAGKKTIGDIFNRTRIIEVPFFQRAYVWDTEQWERMLDDMENICITNKPYFLGSVILKQQPTNTNYKVGDVRTIIDGQQRLTTLNILFKVFCLKSNQNHLFDTFKTISGDISLQHNHNDIDNFNQVLNLTDLLDLTGHGQIISAYNFFKENLDPTKIDFYKILSNVLFVGIDLVADEDEQQIFDTINSLGVKLTTAELLKNYFFNRDIEAYNIFWKNIFEQDEETKSYWDRKIWAGRFERTFIDLFFFSYLQIKIQDRTLNVTTEDKKEFSKVEQLFESYKKFINDYLNNDKAAILSEIKEYALIFRDNFDYDVVENEMTGNSGIERINAIIFGLETSTLIPYVLYILRNVTDESDRNGLFDFIEAFIMRRMVVHANTKNYNRLFTDSLIYNEILSKEQFIDYLEGQADGVNSLPSDQELKYGFDNSRLINKQSSGILYFIESKIRNRNLQSTKLLGLNKYSLEHLMPKKWENHWEKLSSQADIDNRNRTLLTLGNLTIITQSLNSAIRDADWTTKKSGKDNNGLIAYSASLETMNRYLILEKWDEQIIADRAYFLFEKAKEVWKI
jgi:hypothetical protein